MTPQELKAIRARMSLTQDTLARMMGLNFITISRWERGVQAIGIPETAMLRQLAKDKAGAKRARKPLSKAS